MMGFYQQNCEELSWLSWLDAATLKTATRFLEMFLKFGIPFHSSLCVGKKKKLNAQNFSSSIMKVGNFGNKHPILRQKGLEMRLQV